MRRIVWTLVAFTLGVVWSPRPAGAASWCEDCWQGTRTVRGQEISDAQCCISDSDCGYIPDGWWLRAYSVAYCAIELHPEGGYVCATGVPACDGGWGGGGGGGCNLEPGQWCPPSCPSCTYTY